jgi:hypothetical protein
MDGKASEGTGGGGAVPAGRAINATLTASRWDDVHDVHIYLVGNAGDMIDDEVMKKRTTGTYIQLRSEELVGGS